MAEQEAQDHFWHAPCEGDTGIAGTSAEGPASFSSPITFSALRDLVLTTCCFLSPPSFFLHILSSLLCLPSSPHVLVLPVLPCLPCSAASLASSSCSPLFSFILGLFPLSSLQAPLMPIKPSCPAAQSPAERGPESQTPCLLVSSFLGTEMSLEPERTTKQSRCLGQGVSGAGRGDWG